MLNSKVRELESRLKSYDKTLSVVIDRKRFKEEGPTLTIVQNTKGLRINLRFGISPFLSNDVIIKRLLNADMYRVHKIYQSFKHGDQLSESEEQERDAIRCENTIRAIEKMCQKGQHYFF